MGIGIPISVLGYSQLTKGMDCRFRSKRLAQALTQFPPKHLFAGADLEQLLSKLSSDEQSASGAPDIISYRANESAVDRIFFSHVKDDLLLKYAVTFEQDQDALWDIVLKCRLAPKDGSVERTKLDAFIKEMTAFVLQTLSQIIIDSIDSCSGKSVGGSLEKMKLANLTIKINKMYQRLDEKSVSEISSRVLSLPKSQSTLPSTKAALCAPLAYRIYCVAGEYLRLEQRYHNPTSPLIPAHLVAQQRVLASLPFWTHDASSIYTYLRGYLRNGSRTPEIAAELLNVIFYECTSLGRAFMRGFVQPSGELDLDSFMLACVSCCLDPRETAWDCLWDYISEGRHTISADAVKTVLSKITKFAIFGLGELALSQPKTDPCSVDCIKKLYTLSSKDKDTVLARLFPALFQKETIAKSDIKLVGDDCLALRLIDAAATALNARGKIIDLQETVLPLHLLACSSLLKELAFNRKDALAVFSSISSCAGLETEELIAKLKAEIGCPKFVSVFYDNVAGKLAVNDLALASATLCLDQGNTMSECFWKVMGEPEVACRKEVYDVAKRVIDFAVKGIAKMMMEEVVEYPRLTEIQKGYAGMNEEQTKEVIGKVMPFAGLESVRKADVVFVSGDERLVYAILNDAAEILGLNIGNNSLEFTE